MELMEGLQIIKEMCEAFGSRCTGCPLLDNCEESCTGAPVYWTGEQIRDLATAAEEWKEKHRPKTMLEIAKERFPEVKWNHNNNTPDFCPYLLFGKFGYEGVVCSKTKCHECWSRIAPDEYQNGGK